MSTEEVAPVGEILRPSGIERVNGELLGLFVRAAHSEDPFVDAIEAGDGILGFSFKPTPHLEIKAEVENSRIHLVGVSPWEITVTHMQTPSKVKRSDIYRLEHEGIVFEDGTPLDSIQVNELAHWFEKLTHTA